jgi:hypothetical protein
MTAVVGTQLGQTILVGGRDPVVVAAGLASAAILAGIVQTRGLSHAFGCRPLGAIGWTLTAAASGAAAAGAAVAPRAPVRPGGRRHGLAGPVRHDDGGPLREPEVVLPEPSSRRGPEPDYAVELSAAGRASPRTTALATPAAPTTLAPTSPIPARAIAPATGLTRRRTGRTSNTAAAPSANGHISSIADPLWLILRAVAPRDTARHGIDSPAGEPEKRWERETPSRRL